jgi:pilus assembly protein CpaC
LTVGKSTLMRLPSAVERISVGNPNTVDITLISPTEIYLLGKNYGSTNMVIWRKDGATTAIDVNVSIDIGRMDKKLRELMPDEKGIRVHAAADSIILSGSVSSAVKAKFAEDVASAFVRDINRALVLPVMAGDAKVQSGTSLTTGGAVTAATGAAGAKVVNLLTVDSGQQVMLEVKVAEVSKTLLDKLGASIGASAGNGGLSYGILSNFLSTGKGLFSITGDNGNTLRVDAQKDDGLIKILAEPNIISISGQEASFLAGGKIFIPTASTSSGGFPVITLTEKEFGVGLKFTPTVLEGGRIHLKVSPEVSELSQTGSAFTTIGGVSSVLPSITTRRVQTTVQLMDGQSLAIAGLIKNNVNETIKRVPLLGEIPILGALFRSSEFQNDRTELMFVITPRLVKPLNIAPTLPTDNFIPPSRSEFFLGGKLEGSGNAEVALDKPGAAPSAKPQPGGFELK